VGSDSVVARADVRSSLRLIGISPRWSAGRFREDLLYRIKVAHLRDTICVRSCVVAFEERAPPLLPGVRLFVFQGYTNSKRYITVNNTEAPITLHMR
jgi:hypothetical protein